MTEAAVLDRLVAWADAQPSIRALILTSSRARPDGPVDEFSDYDVILAVADPHAFARHDAWQSDFGTPLVRWGDESTLYGVTTHFRGVVYENGVKIDYTVWPEALLEGVSEQAALPDALDVGYRVLLDKDGRTRQWRPPTYRAHVPAKPTEPEYAALVETFWWDTTYVAKSLRRHEVVFAKRVLDRELKLEGLLRMLEWRIELDHDWKLKPGFSGRGLERLISADTASELGRTYVGLEIEDNWTALIRTIALFRRVAGEVGEALGYTYPQVLDDRMTEYLDRVRSGQRLSPHPVEG